MTLNVLVNECSDFSCHKCLGHISKERMKILVNLDFTNLNVCVDCIKGK